MVKQKRSIKVVVLAVCSAFLTGTLCVMAEGEGEKAAKPVETVELLSGHETRAVFKGVVFRRCMGRTSRCPLRCGHSGEFAVFEITEYTKYEKPGEYGDGKQTKFMIQVSDAEKNPLAKDSKGNDLAAVQTALKTLKAGDKVILNWNHNYITSTNADGTGSKFPSRVVVKLEKVEADAEAAEAK